MNCPEINLPDILLLNPSQPETELPYSLIDTPLGKMLAVFGTRGLCLLEFVGQKGVEQELFAIQKALHGRFVFRETAMAARLADELSEYFQGRLKQFSIPLQTIGTAFQQQVWNVLLSIPYGETCSYKMQAERLGNPKAVRAVAAANGQNKISILIPCHRVIGSNGELTGYAGGIERKQKLLDLERQQFQTALFDLTH